MTDGPDRGHFIHMIDHGNALSGKGYEQYFDIFQKKCGKSRLTN